MASFIPFVNTLEDCRILMNRSFKYQNAPFLRVSFETIDKLSKNLPDIPIWLDPGIDGYEQCLTRNKTEIPSYLKSTEESQILADRNFVRNPKAGSVDRFVKSVLNRSLEYGPSWITVPQLPTIDNNERNKINAMLAKATKKWRTEANFNGSLVLPIIFTHQDQLRGKTKWRPRIDNAIKWYKESEAKKLWIVDSSLSDQLGTRNFRDRFAWLVELHQYVKHELSAANVISGPYWGLNLLLWAKGLCDYPGIGLGTAYQYYLSDGFKKKGKARIAIAPLRRTVVLSLELKPWLEATLTCLSSDDSDYMELKQLDDQLGTILSSGISREQTARFYSEWLNRIENAAPAARSLALYQDFSSAYVLGRQLPLLPPSGSSVRKAERVAEYFMLNCL